ncbi:MAG: NAD(P)H-dependent flavin oxidoreductase [Minwuia sp.]|uniref:NAD(P)H-dependent flavin oxidoreductase n=1 Tax=Minwuia sp. TaxID=2493630 RepID=UPI003A8C5001
MMRNALTERFGLKYPIYGFAHSIDVVCALAEAGCMGVWGATRETPEEIEAGLKEIRRRVGSKAFGIDLVLPRGMPKTADKAAIEAELPEEHKDFVKGLYEKYQVPAATRPGMRSRFLRSDEVAERQVAAVLASDVDLFACGIGAPADAVAHAKSDGKVTLALVGSARHAEAAIRNGAEIIVAQGYDAGAHTGQIGTFSLVPQVVDVCGDVPVLAAGGVATGRHIAASFALGAQGVWLGTAWLTTHEHALDEVLVRKLLAAGSEDTVISRADSGKTLRQIRTAWSEEWAAPGAPAPLKMPYQDILVGDLLGAIDEHGVEALIHHPAGQSVAYSTEQKSVADVVRDLVRETEAAMKGLG